MERALFRTWALLFVLAVAGAALAALCGHHLAAVFVILALAFAKARLVVLDFMEMRHTGNPLAPAILGWAGLVLALSLARALAVFLAG